MTPGKMLVTNGKLLLPSGHPLRLTDPLPLPRRLSTATGAVLLGLTIMAIPALMAQWPSGIPSLPGLVPISALPEDQPEDGLLYEGLAPAPKGSPCVGAYVVTSPDVCSHGPDPVPSGLRVGRDVAPIEPALAAPTPPRQVDAPAPDDSEIVRDDGAVTPASTMPALVPDAAPGEASFTMGAGGVACDGDGYTGKRIQVLYLYPTDAVTRYSTYLPSIRAWAGKVDSIYAASAKATGGTRHVRYVTTPDCQVDVAEVQLPADRLARFDLTLGALRSLGYDRTDRKYLLFTDVNVYCGISTLVRDNRPGSGNRNNGGPSYARLDAGCWTESMAAHQLTHTLGAVANEVPNASGAGHCLDDHDLMCYTDENGTAPRVECDDLSGELVLDCNHDDYFNTDPRQGSYLASHWNVADSEFLVRGGGSELRPPSNGGQSPTAGPPTRAPKPSEPAPTPTPTGSSATPTPSSPAATTPPSPPVTPDPSRSVDPSVPEAVGPAPGGEGAGAPAPSPTDKAADPSPPTPTTKTPPSTPDPSSQSTKAEPADEAEPDTAAPSTEGFLRIRDTTSTSTRISWSAAEAGGHYTVTVNGQIIGVTAATRGRIIGLRPDTGYEIQISVGAADGDLRDHTDAIPTRTAPAAQPIMQGWFRLTNALTGSAAHLYAARSSEDTPIVAYRSDGVIHQQWRLRPVGKAFLLMSRATGKCVVPLGGRVVAGNPLVQGTCQEADIAQHWMVMRTDHGFTLRAADGDLVMGVGEQRYGDSHLLVLQSPATVLHQSWTALPG